MEHAFSRPLSFMESCQLMLLLFLVGNEGGSMKSREMKDEKMKDEK